MAHEEEELARQQAHSIKPYAPTGALIKPSYLERRQEVIGVNRNDLVDIMTFDALELGFMGSGGFFLSGVWLGAEKLLDQAQFQWTPILVLCAVSAVFGSILLISGGIMRWQKRGRIKRIFDETTPIGT